MDYELGDLVLYYGNKGAKNSKDCLQLPATQDVASCGQHAGSNTVPTAGGT